MTIDQANEVIMQAIGGENVTTTIEGRERYPVNVRYLRDYRSDLDEAQPCPRDGARTARRSPWPRSPTSSSRPGLQ